MARKSKFTEETRSALLATLASGSTVKDACAFVGIGETTFYEWLQIGEARLEGRPHPRMPYRLAERDAFAEFAESIKKARATAQFRAVKSIQAAGQDRWTHRKTGQTRTSAPPPITWMHQPTGQIIHENPARREEYGDPALWEKQWSGEAWEFTQGDWKPLAWYLERSDYENWGRRSRQDVFVDWRVEAAEIIRQEQVTYEILEREVGSELARELFESAGLSVADVGEGEAGS